MELKLASPHDEGVQRASPAALGGGRRCSTSRFVPCGRPERPPVAGAPIGRPLRANPPEACRSGSLRPRERGQEKPPSSSPCVRWLRWRVSEGEAPQPTPRAEASSWERECGARELWLWSSGVGLVVVWVGGPEGCAADLLAVTGAPALHHYPEVRDVVVEPASLYVV